MSTPPGWGNQPPQQQFHQGYGPPPPGNGPPPPGQRQPGPQQWGPGQQQWGPGRGPGWNPQQPPRKNRAGVVVLVVVLALLGVGGLATVGGFFWASTRDRGTPQVGATMPEQCALGDDVLAAAKTTNRRSSQEMSENWHVCVYGQTLGQDGSDARDLVAETAVLDDEEMARGNFRTAQAGQVRPIDGLGDEAVWVLSQSGTSSTTKAIVREGATIHQVTYSGFDRGVFSNSPVPQDEAESITRRGVESLLGR
ncbi:hypothetical protein [Umezawaea beigongshangensis]|uniref:hypothetical protein n=1 Tax=Umezawaea beigongshangensis TaxID=2780383 RepID=UPI0018F19F4F|nr:hypothetical protein [Umezawaea beigongshangensis]